MLSLSEFMYAFRTTFELGGNTMLPFVLLAAAVWGLCVAAFMQYTRLGEFLSLRLTWFMTALGCGVDLLLLLLVQDEMGRVFWWQIIAVFGVSSIGPSLRGILLHKNYFGELMDGARDTVAE